MPPSSIARLRLELAAVVRPSASRHASPLKQKSRPRLPASGLSFADAVRGRAYMSMPPMPPMPPPWPWPWPSSFFGASAIGRLGGDQQAGDGGRILQRDAHDLGRIDDALLDHVAVLVVLGVVAEGLAARLEHLADDDRALDAGVLGDLADRRLQRAA